MVKINDDTREDKYLPGYIRVIAYIQVNSEPKHL